MVLSSQACTKVALSNIVCHHEQVTATDWSGLCPLERPGQIVQVLTGSPGAWTCPLDCGDPADLDKLQPAMNLAPLVLLMGP